MEFWLQVIQDIAYDDGFVILMRLKCGGMNCWIEIGISSISPQFLKF